MKELVIFDVDNTLLHGQSQSRLLRFLYKNRKISFQAYFRILAWFTCYKLGLVNEPEKIMKYGFSFSAGKKPDEIRSLIDGFFQTDLKQKLYPEALRIIEEHQKAGRLVILLSNSVDVLVRRVGMESHVEDVICTQLEIKDGVYTGNVLHSMYGIQKLRAIEKYLLAHGYEFQNVWAYGDHSSDSYLLEKVGHPFAVNPSRALRKRALKSGWPILHFSLRSKAGLV